MSTPSTFAQKRRHLPWSKLYADAWLRVRNSSISVGAMLTWVDLQLLFIQSEKPGCLIEQGQPIPIKSLALRLGKKESKLEREIEELVQIGVLSQNASIGISDIRMTIDEAATSYETGRKTIRGKSRIKATNSYSGFPNTRPREEQEQEREQEEEKAAAAAGLAGAFLSDSETAAVAAENRPLSAKFELTVTLIEQLQVKFQRRDIRLRHRDALKRYAELHPGRPMTLKFFLGFLEHEPMHLEY